MTWTDEDYFNHQRKHERDQLRLALRDSEKQTKAQIEERRRIDAVYAKQYYGGMKS